MTISNDDLKDVAKRIMTLEGEKDVLAEDIKEIYQEAKSKGADTKILRKTIAAMKIEKQEREALAEGVDNYLQVIEG